jgi:hypothetical protein
MGEDGASAIGLVVLVLIVVAGIYAAYKFAPSYVSYRMLRVDVNNEAETAHMYTDAVIESHILKKAEGWAVPLDGEGVEIERGYDYITVSVHYTVTVSLFDRYERELVYDIRVTKPLKSVDRVLQ